jgi:hypothetical protein
VGQTKIIAFLLSKQTRLAPLMCLKRGSRPHTGSLRMVVKTMAEKPSARMAPPSRVESLEQMWVGDQLAVTNDSSITNSTKEMAQRSEL